MLVMVVQTVNTVRGIDDRISVQMFLFDLSLWNFKFHFGSVFKIMNLEYEIFRQQYKVINDVNTTIGASGVCILVSDYIPNQHLPAHL